MAGTVDSSVAIQLVWSIAGFVVGCVVTAAEIYYSACRQATDFAVKRGYRRRFLRRAVPVTVVGVTLCVLLVVTA